jgi:hypothetical protein
MAKDIIHPDVKAWIARGGDPELHHLFPKLSSDEKSYLELITSEGYEQLVAKLEKYTGLEATAQNLPSIISITMQSLSNVRAAESSHKQYLEKLALDFVLSFDEFKMVRDAYDNGDLEFDLQLMAPDIDLVGDDDEPENLSVDEEANLDLADGFAELSIVDIQRRLADILIQGSATLKIYAFHLLDKELKKINKNLVNWYGVLACAAEIGYWVTPDGIERTAAKGEAKVGAEEVVPSGERYVIRAQAVVFPYLVHELVKGIYDWVSIRPEFAKATKRGVSGETPDIIIGPQVFKRIQKMIPSKKQHLLPLVQKKLIELSPEDIQKILSESPEGQRLINNVIREAEFDWEEYQQEEWDGEEGDEEEFDD